MLNVADDLLIQKAAPEDHPTASAVLVDAFRDGAVTTWAEPDPTIRGEQLHPYFTALLAHAGNHGSIHIAQRNSRLVGVAVWFPYPGCTATGAVHSLPGTDDDGPVPEGAKRLARLEELLKDVHPTAPHHYLAYLGVAPAQQNRGVGTALLNDYHAGLIAAGTPAYLEANDPRNRKLYIRHGYADLGTPVTAGDSPPVFPMWWNPAARRH